MNLNNNFLKPTQKLFGKTYNRCVKAGDELNHDGESLQEMNPSFDINPKKQQLWILWVVFYSIFL